MLLDSFKLKATESTYLGCVINCHQSAYCFSFNWCRGRFCQLNSGHRHSEEGQLNFISNDGCIYSGWSFDDGPVCEDGQETDTFCHHPWRQNPEWSGWEPRYLFEDDANKYSERQDQFCGKLRDESDCSEGSSMRFPISILFFQTYETWEDAREEDFASFFHF